jgi:PAS domain-containing protein
LAASGLRGQYFDLVKIQSLASSSVSKSGVTFETQQTAAASDKKASTACVGDHALRSQMLALRAALDVMPLGIVPLDPKLNARFINLAFRRMYRCPTRSPRA